MRRTLLLSSIGALCAIMTLSSCRKKAEVHNPTGSGSDYDAILLKALEEASETNSADFFKMPSSVDYASIPQDPTNPLTSAKVELGKLLFHETGIALNPKDDNLGTGTYSCASCHHAWAGFQANMQQGIGEGGMGFGIAGEGRTNNPAYPIDSLDVQPLRTPTAMNGAFQKVMLWNGQFGATGPNAGTEDVWPPGTPIWNNHFGHEGLEIQAIAGLTVHRMLMDEEVCAQYGMYEDLFDIAFPEWPVDNRYTERTAGLAIAAYERTLLSNEAPFQLWLGGDLSAMTDSQKEGAALFFGEANCVSCHTGPALNSMTFYALGMEDMNGNGTYQSGSELDANKGRGSFTGEDEDDYKFKTPQLYNLTDSPFMGHGGTFNSVREVIEYKNTAVPENAMVPESQIADEFVPLGLSDSQIDALVDFIENGLYDANLFRYVPQDVVSGNCIPNNDAISIIDQGCIN